jgi:hypothetical protein
MMRTWKGNLGAATITDCTAAFTLLMATRQFVPIDLYDVALLNLGRPNLLVFRWASSYYDVPFPGPDLEGGVYVEHVYAGADRYVGSPVTVSSPRPDGGTLKHTIGVEVDTLDLNLLLDGQDLLVPADGNPLTRTFGVGAAVRMGLFEGAVVIQRRLFLPKHPNYPIIHNHPSLSSSFDTAAGAVTRFAGQVTQSILQGSKASLKVKTLPEKFALGMPRHVWQAACRFNLYDQMCRVDPLGSTPGGVPFRRDAPVTLAFANLTDIRVNVAVSPPPDRFFDLGMLRFLSGPLAGFSTAIREYRWTSGTEADVHLLRALPAHPVAGSVARMQKGCPKNETACENDFANFIDMGDHAKGLRFGGMPAIPAPEVAV